MTDLGAQRQDLVRRVLAELTGLPVDRILPDTQLMTEGYLTSLQVVEVVNALEGATGTTFLDEDITADNFDTPRAMAALLAKREKEEEG